MSDKEKPPAEAVGLMPDGSINIGTPEQMRAKMAAAAAENATAQAYADRDMLDEEQPEDGADL